MSTHGFKKAYKIPLLYIPCLPCKRCHSNFLPVSYGQKKCLQCLSELDELKYIVKFDIKIKREAIIQDIIITWLEEDNFQEIQDILTIANDSYLKQNWYTIVYRIY